MEDLKASKSAMFSQEKAHRNYLLKHNKSITHSEITVTSDNVHMYTYGDNTHGDWVGEGATAREVLIVICTNLKNDFSGPAPLHTTLFTAVHW